MTAKPTTAMSALSEKEPKLIKNSTDLFEKMIQKTYTSVILGLDFGL
jgi:hypothetical protein